MQWDYGIQIVLFFFAISIGLTVLIELPIIRLFHVTKRNLFIIAVNALTNVIFNMGLVFLIWRLAVYEGAEFIVMIIGYVLLAEFYVIPFSECELYCRISEKQRKSILKACYVANVSSFVLGCVFDFLFLSYSGNLL